MQPMLPVENGTADVQPEYLKPWMTNRVASEVKQQRSTVAPVTLLVAFAHEGAAKHC